MSLIGELLYSLAMFLVEEWVYGLILAVAATVLFLIWLEDIHKKRGMALAVIVGAAGGILYIWAAMLLMKNHTFFAVAMLALAAGITACAYIPNKEKKNKE